MPVNHREIAFEEAIEANLAEHGGYTKGNPDNFNRDLALDPTVLFQFIEATQTREWEKLIKVHGSQVKDKFLYRLNQELNNRGLLDVIRHGVNDYGAKINLAYFKSASNLNPDAHALYKKNLLTVTRQVHFSPKDEKSLDMVLSINGLPIVTLELKNPLTGQTVENAQKQYMYDRSPRELIFEFKKRTLVHFAVDPDLVFMTTKLAHKDTVFLPFNKGKDNGAGNPENPDGYKTSYLWEEVLTRDSLLVIVGKFLHLEVKEKVSGTGQKIRTENMVFPRYHQLSVVRNLESHAKEHGSGKNYLVQHSAGSGKSNSIAWIAHRLSNLHNAKDEPVFDSVIVITDRLVLDRQLQDTIYQFEHKQGVVQKIDENSDQLAEALKSGTKIIITTLQKFPFVIKKIESLPNRKYAVIVDEAHSSQTGESAKALKEVLSAGNLEEATKAHAAEEGKLTDTEEEIVKAMLARQQQANLSFFAFTATPKQKTLEMFGERDKDGKPRPFHLYSMRQAIEEGFIHDVLKNYTTYDLFFKLSKQIQDDPKVDKKKAAIAIARFVSLHPHNLAQKTEIIIEHFRQSVRHKIGGQAKAMVVTSSRPHAVRYKLEFDRYLKEKNYTDVKALVAFSGTVNFERVEYTEPGMNKFGYGELPDKFKTDSYQVLLVADKYQTGFDQPLLHTMYVDKKLSGVKAVQTLSRLNRTCPGKTDTFVLDFVNSLAEIKESFQPYYEVTTLEDTTDANKLYDLKNKLDFYQIYWNSEIDQFAEVFFKPRNKQSEKDHAKLYGFLNPAVDRYNTKKEEQQDEFKHLLMSFTRLYSFLTQVIPFFNADLEKFYAYSQFLLKKLPKKSQDDRFEVGDDIALKYYRLEKAGTFAIALDPQEGVLPGMSEVWTARESDKFDQLSTIIDALNQRFATDFTAADELFFDQLVEDCIADEKLKEQAKSNPIENFKFGFNEVFTDKLVNRMDQNQSMFSKIMDNQEFQDMVKKLIMAKVYEASKGK